MCAVSIGDSLTGLHNGRSFTTTGMSSDELKTVEDANCAEIFKGGWWYGHCLEANLNGHYYPGSANDHDNFGLVWKSWHGVKYSLKATKMMMRPA